MKLFALAACAIPAALGATTFVTFDSLFDNPNGSLRTVACSNGLNGLLTRGFTTFSSLPTFPRIGGAPQIEGFDSPNCGACFNISFPPVGASIVLTGIDTGANGTGQNGFNIALEALDMITRNQGAHLGHIEAEVTRLDPSACGL